MREMATLVVTGMKCGGCEAQVSGVLGAMDGVFYVTASSKEQQVHIEFDNEVTPLAVIQQAIRDTGYTVVTA